MANEQKFGKADVMMSDAHIKNLGEIENKLVESLVNFANLSEFVAKSWDKITWGRSSSKIDELGKPYSINDRVEFGINPNVAMEIT